MRIAVTYEDGQVFQHFGRTEKFKLYDAENGQIQGTSLLEAGENGHGALAGFLKGAGVDTLICGGIGAGARQALAGAGIRLYGGVSGDTDKAVENLLANRLVFNPDVQCNHHGEGHHYEGGNCHGH